jgi:hypothetical protein
MKKINNYWTVTSGNILVLFVILAISLCGCIEVGAKDDTGTAVQTVATPLTSGNGAYSPSPAKPSPYQIPPTESVAPSVTSGDNGGFVKDANPIPPSNALNITPLRNITMNDPSMQVSEDYPNREIYRGTYDLKFSNAALLANISKAPFIVDFHVEPGCDNPNDCFFRLTIRDNKTMKIVGEEGYGMLYSTEVDKRMIVREPGVYHLNLYGNRIKVTISLRTGTGDIWYTTVPTPAQVVNEEELPQELQGRV